VKHLAYEVRDQVLEPLLSDGPMLRLVDAPEILRCAMAKGANVYDGNQMVLLPECPSSPAVPHRDHSPAQPDGYRAAQPVHRKTS
jgi:hypothetical protein